MNNEKDFAMVAQSQNNAVSNPQSEMVVSRQAQEVQVMMACAQRFPRNSVSAYNRIMEACKRRKLAEEAQYEYPRGGQKITGPSIRLAEVIAQNWGNLDFGVIELAQANGKSEMMAYCWDMETNVRQVKTFAVKHVRKAHGTFNKLDDPRDIYEMVASQGARRMRACILGIIPSDIVDDAERQCEATLLESETKPLADRIRIMTKVFKDEWSVSQEMIEKRFGCKADALSERDMLALKRIYKSLADGMAKREDFFEVPSEKDPSMAQIALEAEQKESKPKEKNATKKKTSSKQQEVADNPQPTNINAFPEEPIAPIEDDDSGFSLEGDGK